MNEAPRSSAWRMADRLLAGSLAERLTALRADRRSYDDIAKTLYAEAGVAASGRTIAAWCAHLGIESTELAS